MSLRQRGFQRGLRRDPSRQWSGQQECSVGKTVIQSSTLSSIAWRLIGFIAIRVCFRTIAKSGAPKALGVAVPNASSNRLWLRPVAAVGARPGAGFGAKASRSPGTGAAAEDMGAACRGAGLGESKDRQERNGRRIRWIKNKYISQIQYQSKDDTMQGFIFLHCRIIV